MPYSFSRIRPDSEFTGRIDGARLREQLSEAMIPRDAVLMVHSSLRAIGPVEGGAAAVINALLGHLSGGLLVLPAYTFETVTGGHNSYDPFTEPSCSGLLGEALLMLDPSAARSLHPGYSVAVSGSGVRSFIEGEQFSSTPFPRSGCMGRLFDMDGYILLAGVGLDKCAFISCIEEWNGIEGRLSEPETRYIADYSGNLLMSSVSDLSGYGRNEAKNYVKLMKPLECMGAARACRFGDAECLLLRCSAVMNIAARLLLLCPGLFENARAIPKKTLKCVMNEIAD